MCFVSLDRSWSQTFRMHNARKKVFLAILITDEICNKKYNWISDHIFHDNYDHYNNSIRRVTINRGKIFCAFFMQKFQADWKKIIKKHTCGSTTIEIFGNQNFLCKINKMLPIRRILQLIFNWKRTCPLSKKMFYSPTLKYISICSD